MRYFYEKPNTWGKVSNRTYRCNGGWYHRCCLYLQDDLGLALVQQRFDPESGICWWEEPDEWLAWDIYIHKGFRTWFSANARPISNEGLYPVFTVRQAMWALKMKPLKKEWWEEHF